MTKHDYDIFISYAMEDAVIADSLANELVERGLNVWLDKIIIKPGDSIRRAIDKGIGNSRYGAVIISKNFLKKQWPQWELDGLVMREMSEARKIVLPIWHDIDASDVRKYSAPLSDKKALNTNEGMPFIADNIAALFGSPSTKLQKLTDVEKTRGIWYRNINFKVKISETGTFWEVLWHVNVVAARDNVDGFAISFRIDDLILNTFVDEIEERDIFLEEKITSHPRSIERYFRFAETLNADEEKTITYKRSFKKAQPNNLLDFFASKGAVRCDSLNISVAFDENPEKIFYRISDRAETVTFEEYAIDLDYPLIEANKIISAPDRNLSYGFWWKYVEKEK